MDSPGEYFYGTIAEELNHTLSEINGTDSVTLWSTTVSNLINSDFSKYSGEEDNSSATATFTVDAGNDINKYYNETTTDYSKQHETVNSSKSIIMDAITTTPYSPGVNSDLVAAMERQVVQFWVGVALSISSSVFIGLSFIIKKKALIRLSKGGKRANQGGYGYLKDLLWWSGLLSMAIGEAANFMAYTFAPASLVSTLGVLSVLVTAILSSKYLHERLNFLGKVGCFLCAIGSTVIVIHAPMEKDIESMEDLQSKLTNITFVMYVLLTIVSSLVLVYHYRPKLPETSTYTLLIWIGVCSMIGSLSVMSVKGLGLALMQTVNGQNEFDSWLTWFCFVTLVMCVSVQMNFLNKALDTFNTAVVTPIYYVFFTTCVIVASAILFNEFSHLPITDWVGLSCGFLIVLTAIALLHICKNFDFTLVTLTQQIDLVNDSHSNNSTAGAGHRLHNHQPVKGDSHPLAFNTSSSTLTSCAIVTGDEMVVKCQTGDIDDDDQFKSEDAIFRSKNAGGSVSTSALTPEARLLSGTFSNSLGLGSRSRDGYIPLSYGTTDNHHNF